MQQWQRCFHTIYCDSRRYNLIEGLTSLSFSLSLSHQICPICAALPGGDPNHVTDDFTAHLTLEHRAPRDLISFLGPHQIISSFVFTNHKILMPYRWLCFPLTGCVYDESSSVRHVRRMFHPGRGLGGPRARRTNMHFTSSSTGGLSSSSSQSSTYTPSNREAMDPIAGENQGCPLHIMTLLFHHSPKGRVASFASTNTEYLLPQFSIVGLIRINLNWHLNMNFLKYLKLHIFTVLRWICFQSW